MALPFLRVALLALSATLCFSSDDAVHLAHVTEVLRASRGAEQPPRLQLLRSVEVWDDALWLAALRALRRTSERTVQQALRTAAVVPRNASFDDAHCRHQLKLHYDVAENGAARLRNRCDGRGGYAFTEARALKLQFEHTALCPGAAPQETRRTLELRQDHHFEVQRLLYGEGVTLPVTVDLSWAVDASQALRLRAPEALTHLVDVLEAALGAPRHPLRLPVPVVLEDGHPIAAEEDLAPLMHDAAAGLARVTATLQADQPSSLHAAVELLTGLRAVISALRDSHNAACCAESRLQRGGEGLWTPTTVAPPCLRMLVRMCCRRPSGSALWSGLSAAPCHRAPCA